MKENESESLGIFILKTNYINLIFFLKNEVFESFVDMQLRKKVNREPMKQN